ncbi:DUF6221 family protein [uncultured Jatrophihabitans sp.]|uniref:DUF6221 family protein n=1 Tax=uncultured Jatrophihabitans sp. TaxID=1610747 RepID=UPI0035CAF08C
MPASAKSSATSALVDFVHARLDDEDSDIARSPDSDERQRRAVDVRARREVVASVQELLGLRDQPNEKAVRDLAISILRSLATPFADHPAFREEWHAATR